MDTLYHVSEADGKEESRNSRVAIEDRVLSDSFPARLEKSVLFSMEAYAFERNLVGGR
jgi:hypothetical protein